jgi:tetratricopeptide (TPR) repeat protein
MRHGLLQRVWLLLSIAIAGCAGSPIAAPPSQSATLSLLRSDHYQELDELFSRIQQGYDRGAVGDENLRAAFRVFYDSDPTLAPKYDLWVANFPKSYVAHLARGIYYAHVGDALRGVHFLDKTPPGRLKAAESAYEKAKADFDASLALDPKPLLSYSNAMTITGDHGDLEGSRRLLDRALSIDPNTYIARAKYMTVIMTRWGGSHEMLQQFFEECRQAKLSAEHMRLLESVLADDAGWIYQFIDHNYPAAEAAYRRSAALGGDKELANLTDVLALQHKYAEAIEPLTERLAATPNDVDLLTNRSLAYMQSGKPGEGLRDLTAAAEGGSASAQNELGRLYMTGIPGILTPDMKAGVAWFRKSAAQGFRAGQENLDRARALYPGLVQ